MTKRYQVFVSSTYADLKQERQRVMQALMEMDCIPAGMELFPAADEEQWQFIQRVIDDCDYYLLIIGGRYGSTTPEGVSYTEKEYDYAVHIGLKVIALLHENPDDIPVNKADLDPALRGQLMVFREKVKSGRLVRFWTAADQLPGLVALSLSKTIKTYPAIGWVRANAVANEELLAEVNELRKDNDALRAELAGYGAEPLPQVEHLAGLDENVTLHVRSWGSRDRQEDWTIDPTWRQIFGYIAPYLLKFPNEISVKDTLEKALVKLKRHGYRTHALDDQDFQTVAVQFKALGLVELSYSKTTKGDMAMFWSLTKAGESLMLQLRTITSSEKQP